MSFSSLTLALLLAAAFEPLDVTVPAALRARTSNPELSGLAWAPALGKWLVVSDDTGLRDAGTWHAPWLLALSAEGALDTEPVPIEGLDRLNDAESMTPLPDGTFLLLTSHSPNKKGKVKPARCLLVHLGFEGKALKLLRRIDLAAAAPRLAELAGSPGSPVDLEAVAVHDGALFIGLKSPLDAQGRASIVRAAGLGPALASGEFAADAFERWAAVDLAVPGKKGQRVHQGIADLAFLPGGALVLAANSPKGAPADGGGALWKLESAKAAPVLLRQFDGLKPEGVAVSPDGKSLTVVFDTGQATAKWAHGALP